MPHRSIAPIPRPRRLPVNATERERRAYAWHRRRRELGIELRIGELARALGLGRRTIERYEYDGAPGWYELALIGLSRSERRRQTTTV